MSLIRSTQYPGHWNVPDSNSPQGSGKNRTSPTSNDGSYFDETWFNDMDSLHQALFIASGITPNGVQDVGTASQIFDALLNNRWSSIGNYSVGTIVTASNGKQYYCNQASGRDTTPVDPTTDSLDNWREYPAKVTTTSSYHVVEYFDGRVELSFTGNSSGSDGVSDCTIPLGIELSDTNYKVQVSESSSTASESSIVIFGALQQNKTTTSFQTMCIGTNGVARQSEVPQIFISYIKA